MPALPVHCCAMDGCLERRVTRLIGDSYACEFHGPMLLRGDNRELITESTRLLRLLLGDPRPVVEQRRRRAETAVQGVLL